MINWTIEGILTQIPATISAVPRVPPIRVYDRPCASCRRLSELGAVAADGGTTRTVQVE
jgi:hypothetical protein